MCNNLNKTKNKKNQVPKLEQNKNEDQELEKKNQ